MKYTLIADIGNSQIEIGIFEQELVGKFYFATKTLDKDFDTKIIKRSLKKLNISEKDIKGGMIFSVVPHITRLVQIIVKGENEGTIISRGNFSIFKTHALNF